MGLTNTNVRYLLTIYHLSQARLEVSSKDIAQTLDVSRASVTSMMSILTDKRLVTKERYGKVHLTDDGCRWARVLASQTDKLAETLQNRMELSYEEAWKAACAAVSGLVPVSAQPARAAASIIPAKNTDTIFFLTFS